MKITRSFEIRSIDENSRTIEGCAIVFDSYSRNLGGFIEKISRDAISEDMLAQQDIIFNVNHNNDRMLARYNKGEGTLSVELREDGVYFRFEAPETALGDEILYHVRNRNFTECSFRFNVLRQNLKRFQEGEQYVQVINKIENILDLSIVSRGAYEDTSVFSRDEEEAKKEFEEIKAEVDKENEEKRLEEERIAEENRQQEILDNLDSLRENFLKEIE